MGNQICCQQPISEVNKQYIFQIPNGVDEVSNSGIKQTLSHDTTPKITPPQLTENILKVINKHQPFQQQFNSQPHISTVAFGPDIYVGPLDQTKRPTQIGKMYKGNGAYFIGNFIDGKAEGPCFYIMKDGSYFKGQMKDNKAQCLNGKFVSQNLQYTGGFKDNQFNGKGVQKALDHVYEFEGTYQNGKKKQGIMRWGKTFFEHIYEGKFNENGQFTGKGKYTDPQGTYEGQFVNGQKHGFGVYYYRSKLRYEGQYVHNRKQGQGKIVNLDGSIAYKGVFKNGMPNGKGVATSKTGVQFEANWVDGIDARLL